MFSGFQASASALTAQRLRMDVVSSNMANAETTRGRLVDGEWQPYRRKMVSLAPNQSNNGFRTALNNELQGVKVRAVEQDTTPFKLVYQPEHPDANEQGYVEMPNVDPLREMVDLMSSTRSYEANVTALNASKNMLLKTLEIGK
ncbi:flagellar basal body rod protein FlgC [Alkalicoccobacillus porphyridii]|uniref:Flagellar basal-body rod protein FlgC n=1 Tax=Alkalicoccobacillus porphyridii TaxID=2597270 RepID=A0A553ZYI8_9BACI|nr:flagellar basal body rod protein FlgC [Alkalicoccobacillus porphyridii]TSB46511.1 flagellar basal body rod protein FlgC [Alkalicoccobacillus porphyridii]